MFCAWIHNYYFYLACSILLLQHPTFCQHWTYIVMVIVFMANIALYHPSTWKFKWAHSSSVIGSSGTASHRHAQSCARSNLPDARDTEECSTLHSLNAAWRGSQATGAAHVPASSEGLMLMYSQLTSVSGQPGEGQWLCDLAMYYRHGNTTLVACH